MLLKLGLAGYRASGSLWEPFGASGNLREPLARKIGNMTFKKEASVDYSLRMKWPLEASGALFESLSWQKRTTVSCSRAFLSTRISKNANSLVLRGFFEQQN